MSPDYKPTLDKTFLRQLRAILRVGFRSWHSKETMILVMHSCFLILRTVLSLGVARLDGRLVRDIVSADGRGFLRGLGLWFLLAIPSTYTNTMVSDSHIHVWTMSDYEVRSTTCNPSCRFDCAQDSPATPTTYTSPQPQILDTTESARKAV